ncbi:hypothetical protein ACFL1G_06590, partial [Planctomycetota bacterium]
YTPQDDSQATTAPKLKKDDGYLDFAEPAERVRRKILGLWPWPGASALYQSQKTGKATRITLAMAEVVKTDKAESPQHGVFDDELNVICGTDALKIKKIKPAGSPLMDFKDFVNGRRTRPGDMLLKISK